MASSSSEIGAVQWIAWLIGAAAGTFALMSFAYSEFESKDTANLRKVSIEQRMDSIEKKLDVILDSLVNRRR